jgi:NAD(P)-dependent dehydrogenase (short-subunit alcohol dehydrogenase family)
MCIVAHMTKLSGSNSNQIRFDDQVTIVTGAGRGLGRAHALELARRGARVVINDIGGVGSTEGPSADRVVAEIIDAGGEAVASYDDVTKPEGGESLVETALDAFGSVDVVINNAGFGRNALIEEMTIEMFDAVVDVCLRGAFCVTKPAWKVMKAKGYGRVVMTSSASGTFGRRGGANDCAGKAGLVGLTRGLAHEGSHCGINVNCLLPFSATEMVSDNPIPEMERLRSAIAAVDGRHEPERVTPLVVFLASRQCEANGQTFSSVLGRYARGYFGMVDGWISPGDEIPSAEDILAHVDEVDGPEEPEGINEYTAVFDEVERVGVRVNSSLAR